MKALAAVLLTSSIASAAPIHGDVEVDPTAYALSGNSIHVGIGYEHLRLDLGNFALALPQLVHGEDGFDVAFDGFGAKLQWFPRDAQTGVFLGVDAGVVRVHARLQGTAMSDDDLEVQTGVDVGYRFALPAGFYITSWIGVGYAWSTKDVMLGGKTYEPSPITVFPAVHLGYRFR
jgi:hypothetical protein